MPKEDMLTPEGIQKTVWLQEEVKTGSVLIAELTDKCRKLEAQLAKSQVCPDCIEGMIYDKCGTPEYCPTCKGTGKQEPVCPEVRLMKVLVEGGIVRKDATPTYSELLVAVAQLVKQEPVCPELRTSIEQLEIVLCYAVIAFGDELIVEKEMDLYRDYVTDSLVSLCQGTGKHSKPKEVCGYCDKKADGAMLVMGNTMAHSDCVIQKLNELLDPDYEGRGKPSKIVGFKHSRPDRGKIACLICGRLTRTNCMLAIENKSCHWCVEALEKAAKIYDLFDEEGK